MMIIIVIIIIIIIIIIIRQVDSEIDFYFFSGWKAKWQNCVCKKYIGKLQFFIIQRRSCQGKTLWGWGDLIVKTNFLFLTDAKLGLWYQNGNIYTR